MMLPPPADLGGEHDLVAITPGGEPAADDALGRALRFRLGRDGVHLGGVEEVDPGIDRAVDGRGPRPRCSAGRRSSCRGRSRTPRPRSVPACASRLSRGSPCPCEGPYRIAPPFTMRRGKTNPSFGDRTLQDAALKAEVSRLDIGFSNGLRRQRFGSRFAAATSWVPRLLTSSRRFAAFTACRSPQSLKASSPAQSCRRAPSPPVTGSVTAGETAAAAFAAASYSPGSPRLTSQSAPPG